LIAGLACAVAVIVASFCLACSRRVSAREEYPRLAGDWVGSLDGGAGGKLVTVLRIEEDGAQGYRASVLSPMQTELAFGGSLSLASGTQLAFRFKALGAEYRATLDPEGAGMKGSWAQRGAKLPLELSRHDGPFVFSRPQEPEPPYGYKTADIEFPGGSEGVRLSGTLSYPEGGRAKAGIVLVSGSGAQDRNESLMGHKPFLVLADRLTKAGYAVLRYDDRGTAKSTGDFQASTTYDFLSDAAAALAALRARAEVRAPAYGVVGHSEGALIATLMAGDTRAGQGAGIDFAVALAGPAFPGSELLLQQSQAILEASGKGGLAVEAARRSNQKIYGIVTSMPLGPEMRKRLKAAYLSMGVLGKNADAQIASVMTPWFKAFLELDPGPSARSARVPLLALYGTKDVQVPSPANPDKMREDLKASGGAYSAVIVLDGLNHLFQKAGTGGVAEYGQIGETLNPALFDALIGWLDGLKP
jgi:pimeloyl-ACP methyl ester carboxylesterase